jgi:hypothetical protein
MMCMSMHACMYAKPQVSVQTPFEHHETVMMHHETVMMHHETVMMHHETVMMHHETVMMHMQKETKTCSEITVPQNSAFV